MMNRTSGGCQRNTGISVVCVGLQNNTKNRAALTSSNGEESKEWREKQDVDVNWQGEESEQCRIKLVQRDRSNARVDRDAELEGEHRIEVVRDQRPTCDLRA